MTPALYFHPSTKVDLAAMARRVIARDRGDEPGRLYPDILDVDRQACVATQKRLAVLLSDRATHHAVQAAQGAEDGSTEALAEALDTLAFKVTNTPETAPSIIKLAEIEMAVGKLEATPAVTAVLDACGSGTNPMEGFIEAIMMAISCAEAMREAPGSLMPSTPTSMPSSEEGAEA